MELGTRLFIFGGAIVAAAVAAAALWWQQRKSQLTDLSLTGHRSEPGKPAVSMDPNKDLIKRIQKFYEASDEDSAERWFLSFQPETSGVNILLYGNMYYWTLFYKDSWVKFDVFCNLELGHDAFRPGPVRQETQGPSSDLLLPAGVPLNFYVFNSGILALQTFQLQDAATHSVLTLPGRHSGSEPFQFSCPPINIGKAVYCKTIVELEQVDEARREKQMIFEPPFQIIQDGGALRVLNISDSTHAGAIKSAMELQSAVVLGASFKVVSHQEFSAWICEHQVEQADSN